MNSTEIFIIFFFMLSLQSLITIFQVKNFRKNLREFSGNGIVGVGHNQGILKPGSIVLLNYDQKEDQIIGCRVMKGRTVFARFKNQSNFEGLTLDEIRTEALKIDAVTFKRRRKKHPYDPNELSKKKHPLIQAVEAIERRVQQESETKIKVIRNK